MTILFICGSLDPGKDGVGDYTRRLAAELIRQGHQAGIIAINDRKASTVSEEIQYDLESNIPTYRLPKRLPLKEKKQLTKSYIDEVNPEWLSLQYVPFSFNDRGLPFAWNSVFKALGKGRKWHIMFHELWIEVEKSFKSKKDLLLHSLQQRVILRLLQKLSPSHINTHLPLFKKVLKNKNVDCDILPLFGNIPVVGKTSNKPKKSNQQLLRAVRFGGYLPNYEEFRKQMRDLKAIGERHNLQVQFNSIGGGGTLKQQSLTIARKVLGNQNVKDLGFLAIEDVSNVFLQSDIGISRSTDTFFWKSSSTVSMLEHGLMVLLKTQNIIKLSKTDECKIRFVELDDFVSSFHQEKEKIETLPIIAEHFHQLLSGNVIVSKRNSKEYA